MKGRGIVMFLAVALGVLASMAVFTYVRGVQRQQKATSNDVTVIVAKQDIPAGTNLDDAMNGGELVSKSVPESTLIPGAVNDLTQLKGRVTTSTVLAGEQVTTARLQGSDANTGGLLQIHDGFEALTLSLPAPQAGGGYIAANDHVTIYAQLTDVKILKGSLAQLLKGQLPSSEGQSIGDWTVTLVPDVRVLKVLGATSEGSTSSLQLALELKPEDALRVILANEEGHVWLALLPPGQKGQSQDPIRDSDVLSSAAGPRPL
jgi:Flp pilus assembly protein CpaB